jgi:hypothetical protein
LKESKKEKDARVSFLHVKNNPKEDECDIIPRITHALMDFESPKSLNIMKGVLEFVLSESDRTKDQIYEHFEALAKEYSSTFDVATALKDKQSDYEKYQMDVVSFCDQHIPTAEGTSIILNGRVCCGDSSTKAVITTISRFWGLLKMQTNSAPLILNCFIIMKGIRF